MAKLVLLSIVIGLIAIPVVCARDRDPRRGLFRALTVLFLFDLFYLFAVRFIYPRLL